jgi:hypothetical protein
VTIPSLHPNVSSSLDDNDASPFVGPLLHLHTSLRCLEKKCRLGHATKVQSLYMQDEVDLRSS